MKNRIALNIFWFLAIWGLCLIALIVAWGAASFLVPSGAGRRSGFVLVAGRTVFFQLVGAPVVTTLRLIMAMLWEQKRVNEKTYFCISMTLGLVGGALAAALSWPIVLYESFVFGLILLAAFGVILLLFESCVQLAKMLPGMQANGS
jgi:hypothetical protein